LTDKQGHTIVTMMAVASIVTFHRLRERLVKCPLMDDSDLENYFDEDVTLALATAALMIANSINNGDLDVKNILAESRMDEFDDLIFEESVKIVRAMRDIVSGIEKEAGEKEDAE
jgi:hypothetical protein